MEKLKELQMQQLMKVLQEIGVAEEVISTGEIKEKCGRNFKTLFKRNT